MGKQTQRFESHQVKQAADVLRRGGLLAFATETVYGLGADACDGTAVAGVYAAKGRPAFNPLIIHLPDLAAAERFGVFSPLARKLAEAFWPGPLSLVVPVRNGAGLSSLVTAGLDTVAIRVPAHEGARALLAAFGGPVAAPSANPSGGISPTRMCHVLDGLDGKIDGVLDGGDCDVGLESTILYVGEDVALLRAGGVTVEDVEAVLGQAVARPEDPDTPRSPGQLASHYAPDAKVRINASEARADEVLIGFGAVTGAELNLSETGDLAEAAANLFDMLRRADLLARRDAGTIAISPVPLKGLGLAINDRLSRAAADRD
ncbi:L-threonylcarbamoyladenylate synthase [Neptunicoccus cionae]|uniref:Threonylcarbamoyl-AMP synthase n=1 Tax=Neptunicoccus cionae TaxID=2035344 RepID=A0A916QVV0_9RHOB|nr:L-threonylcarbamoyladenylate synthase [Amylibacter cionae]GGA14776.1 threonylcarbamoyl-AMP synthase [Amylibacter cionae]